ncbi:MAG: NUDIX domain-containing protein [Oscillospiraceae bacterium]|nr:NUDIX domain-containing protein [Oscillospiraceae bacterium]
MDETWDLYDANRKPTGRICRRGDPIPPGDYHLVVHVWIRSGDKYFITRRAPEKEAYPLIWEATGGAALIGEDSLAAALREVKEETGLTLKPENGLMFESIRREGEFCDFADVWLFRQEVSLDDFISQPGETIDARLVTPAELRAMLHEKTCFPFAYMEQLFLFADILEREELLICPPPGTCREAIEALLAEDFVEVGSSGHICARAAGIEYLLQRSEASQEPWKFEGFAVRALSESVCLATYILHWRGGKTRRSTLWRREGEIWRAAYHQGTKLQN